MKVSLYQKRPVVVQAVQINADNYDEMCEIVGWCGGVAIDGGAAEWLGAVIAIDTLEGRMYAEPGDWIIKGVKGEFYPCKPDIFDQSYLPVGD